MTKVGDEPPPIDRAYLESIADGDAAFLEELVVSYLESSGITLGELEDAVRDGDAARIYQAAHSLKGSSRAIGANPAGDAFEILEDQSGDGNLANIDSLMRRATAQYEALVEYVHSVWSVRKVVA